MIKYTFFQGCSLNTYHDGQYSWQKMQISMNLKGPQVTHGNGMFSDMNMSNILVVTVS